MPFTWKDKKDMFKGEVIYHLTFAVVNRVPLLGLLRPLPSNCSDGHIAKVELTDLGITVYQLFNKLRVNYPQMQILAKQLMPDHFHAVVWMKDGFEGSVKMVARSFAQGCSKEARRLAAQGRREGASQSEGCMPLGDCLPLLSAQLNCANMDGNITVNPLAGNTAAIPTASAPSASSIIAASPYDCGNGANTLFAKPFIRTLAHAGQLRSMIDYFHANPDNAWMRRCHPDLYVIRRNVEYAGLRFDAMGKARLLDWPDRQVVALSRSLTTEQIDVEVRKALRLAESGTVTYTAAINEGEKTVAKAVRTAGYPLVIMMLDGFPAEGTEAARYFHPSGVYHTACGEGRLYLMAPKEENYANAELMSRTEEELRLKSEAKGFRYHPIPHTSKRWRMIAGNVMLRMIADKK